MEQNIPKKNRRGSKFIRLINCLNKLKLVTKIIKIKNILQSFQIQQCSVYRTHLNFFIQTIN